MIATWLLGDCCVIAGWLRHLREERDVARVELQQRPLERDVHVSGRAGEPRVAELARVVLDLQGVGGRAVRVDVGGRYAGMM